MPVVPKSGRYPRHAVADTEEEVDPAHGVKDLSGLYALAYRIAGQNVREIREHGKRKYVIEPRGNGEPMPPPPPPGGAYMRGKSFYSYTNDDIADAAYRMNQDMKNDNIEVRYVPRWELEAKHGEGTLAYEDGENTVYIADIEDVDDSELLERAKAQSHEYAAIKKRRRNPGMDHMETGTHAEIYREGDELLRHYLSGIGRVVGSIVPELPIKEALRRAA